MTTRVQRLLQLNMAPWAQRFCNLTCPNRFRGFQENNKRDLCDSEVFKTLNGKFGGVIQITIYSYMTYNPSKKKREKRNDRCPPCCFHVGSRCSLLASCPHMMCELQCRCQVLGRLIHLGPSAHSSQEVAGPSRRLEASRSTSTSPFL